MIKSTMAKISWWPSNQSLFAGKKKHHLSINFPMKKSPFGAMIFHLKPPKSTSDSWGVHSPYLAISSFLNQFTMVHHSGWITKNKTDLKSAEKFCRLRIIKRFPAKSLLFQKKWTDSHENQSNLPFLSIQSEKKLKFHHKIWKFPVKSAKKKTIPQALSHINIITYKLIFPYMNWLSHTFRKTLYLVGGIPTPLKNMSSSVGMMSHSQLNGKS